MNAEELGNTASAVSTRGQRIAILLPFRRAVSRRVASRRTAARDVGRFPDVHRGDRISLFNRDYIDGLNGPDGKGSGFAEAAA